MKTKNVWAIMFIHSINNIMNISAIDT